MLQKDSIQTFKKTEWMSFSREHTEQVRQPDGGKVKLPVVISV